jgi:hypothetical protein
MSYFRFYPKVLGEVMTECHIIGSRICRIIGSWEAVLGIERREIFRREDCVSRLQS